MAHNLCVSNTFLYQTFILISLLRGRYLDHCMFAEAARREQVQRRASLIFTAAQLRWFPLNKRIVGHKLDPLFKMLRGLTPPYLIAALPLQRDAGCNLHRTGDGSLNVDLPINYSLFSTIRQ